MFSEREKLLAQRLGTVLLDRRLVLSTAESCTGGMVSALITSVSGSSQWFDRGFVTYSNQAKQQMLDIEAGDLLEYGAVSQQIAGLMARQACYKSQADITVSITGIAGPDGGTQDKPVGTVWFGWLFNHDGDEFLETSLQLFKGTRAMIRAQSVRFALQRILDKLESDI
ncbi:MAG: CinA family protein [Gammaproteobacteria bacterium]|nr:CinA family protein [Gammaproteobacteria bacterium]